MVKSCLKKPAAEQLLGSIGAVTDDVDVTVAVAGMDRLLLNSDHRQAQLDPVERLHESCPSRLLESTLSRSSSHSSSTESSDGIAIRWGSIEILEFSNVLGDHPGLTGGAPFTIGWDYQQRSTIDIQFFEHYRKHNPRRTRKELQIPAVIRDTIAISLGYSLTELMEVSNEAQKIRKSRQNSMKGTKWNQFVNVFEKTTRGIRGAAGVGQVGAGGIKQQKQLQPKTYAARSG